MHSLLCKSIRHLGVGARCKKAAMGAVSEGLLSKIGTCWICFVLDMF